MRLLCVEDEPALREDIAEFLRMQSYEVDEAASGEEALRRLDARQYDLILCDIKMPHMDGYELLRKVRTENAMVTTPFLFLSALDERDNKLQAFASGCDGYLTKPVDFSVLAATLKAHVERERARANIHISSQRVAQHHMMAAIDDALSGPIHQAVGALQHLRDTVPVLTPQGLDAYLSTVQDNLHQHAAGLYAFHRALEMRTHALHLNCTTILSSDLIRNAMAECAYFHPATPLRYKASNPSAQMLVVDALVMQRAIGGLLAAIPNAFETCEVVTSELTPERWSLTISDHPSMAQDEDFDPIDAFTNLSALSAVTRQRLMALSYALQVVQAHHGQMEVKLWPHDFLAVRFIIPQPPE
jgi:CheY-like chemotaxis protein